MHCIIILYVTKVGNTVLYILSHTHTKHVRAPFEVELIVRLAEL